MASAASAKLKQATFAGGCFWCVEATFGQLPGVTQVISGYTGGKVENPSYEQVSASDTGHVEVIQVTYDTHKTSYKKLLNCFWQQIDSTDNGGQFAERNFGKNNGKCKKT